MNRIRALNRAATSSLLLKNEVSEEENKEKEVKVGHQDLGSSPTFGMSSTATAATTTTTSTSMISIDATNYRGSTPATTTIPSPHRGSFNELCGQSSLGWIRNSPRSTLCSVMHYMNLGNYETIKVRY